eukprot:CAMPEP_0170592928 /NCGR_PEP_ID=MMETSP0224-20130122/13178_1 /TAXON_ID=285029 /ORGANISM="Togula jolla, Strain CCCM 725" /LENGTH=109 /DNA_ID=CAMNT_0010916851 /DNA_START=685 /DNA_END=1012 /DNA_ORIENTATION=-
MTYPRPLADPADGFASSTRSSLVSSWLSWPSNVPERHRCGQAFAALGTRRANPLRNPRPGLDKMPLVLLAVRSIRCQISCNPEVTPMELAKAAPGAQPTAGKAKLIRTT